MANLSPVEGTHKLCALEDLRRGEQGVVMAVAGGDDPALVRRLIEMGVAEGVAVEVLQHGPIGGDPLAVRAGPTTIAMRRAEARLVQVLVTS
jgi:Fe2+ transport system protein FeoA